MDGKNRSIAGTFRTLLVFVWVIVSVVVCGTFTLLFAPLSRRFALGISSLWNRQLLYLAGISVKVAGLEKLDPRKRYVFISNHQSHIDIPVLIASLKYPLSFIAKKELFIIPFFGWGLYALGHIWIDRGNARKALISIKKAVDRLQRGNISLVLFPEGTRSRDGALGQFKQGSFSLVKQAGVEVVPLAIKNTSSILPKYSKRIHSGTAHLTICDPVTIEEASSKAEISEMLRAVIQKALTE